MSELVDRLLRSRRKCNVPHPNNREHRIVGFVVEDHADLHLTEMSDGLDRLVEAHKTCEHWQSRALSAEEALRRWQYYYEGHSTDFNRDRAFDEARSHFRRFRLDPDSRDHFERDGDGNLASKEGE